MDCNRCHCTESRTLMCTKMACLDTNYVVKKNLRSDKTEPLISRLPQVPERQCVPGRIYRKGCRRCFCNSNGNVLCSKNTNGACRLEDGRIPAAKNPEDVRPPFTSKEFKGVSELSNAAKKCEPGNTYKVDCNYCVCTEKFNLLCSKKLCLSFADINRIVAEDNSGLKCDAKNVPTYECVECKCVKGITACSEKKNCVSKKTRAKLSSASKDKLQLQIDPAKDKCAPNGVYTDNCNKCYCQPDGTLRCSMKTCLNYSQSKALDDQLEKL